MLLENNILFSVYFQPYVSSSGFEQKYEKEAHILFLYKDWCGRSGDGIPVGGEIFRTSSDRPWDPTSLLYTGYRVSFPGVKRPGRGVNHPLPSSAKVKERVELYLNSPSVPSWPVLDRSLPSPSLTLQSMMIAH